MQPLSAAAAQKKHQTSCCLSTTATTAPDNDNDDRDSCSGSCSGSSSGSGNDGSCDGGSGDDDGMAVVMAITTTATMIWYCVKLREETGTLFFGGKGEKGAIHPFLHKSLSPQKTTRGHDISEISVVGLLYNF